MDGDARGLGSRLPSGGPSRRTLLLAVPAGLAATLAGCGVRLDLPQPPPPVPTRRPAPDEQLVISVVRELGTLRAALPTSLDGADGRTVERVRKLLAAQAKVLTGRLTNEGVPLPLITLPPSGTGTGTGTATATGSSTGSSTSSPTSTVKEARTAEAAGTLLAESVPVASFEALTSATAPTRGLCSAAYSVRLAGAVLLGAGVPVAAGTAQAGLAERSGALVYAFEVVAAQSGGAQRERATETLTALRALEREVGGRAAGAGWSLPFEVTSPADAERLATEALRAGVDGFADLARSAQDAAALAATAAWSAHVQALAVGWGVPLTPFPGTDES